MYLCHLTYSRMQYKEMLYGLFSLQTNLCISLHYQSDILWHNSTNYQELLFSLDILAGAFLLYVKLIQCSGVAYIYGQLEEGVGSVCHRYMCILWYMKLMLCSGVAYIYGQLEEGVGSVCHRYMCILWYMKLMWCSGVA